jgi:hypothetical protein
VTYVLLLLFSEKLLICAHRFAIYMNVGDEPATCNICLEMESVGFSKMLVSLYQTIQYFAPEDGCFDAMMKA